MARAGFRQKLAYLVELVQRQFSLPCQSGHHAGLFGGLAGAEFFSDISVPRYIRRRIHFLADVAERYTAKTKFSYDYHFVKVNFM